MTAPKHIRFRPSEGVGNVPSVRMMGGIAVEVIFRAPLDGLKDVLPSDEYVVYRRHYYGAQLGELHLVVPSGRAAFSSWLMSIYLVLLVNLFGFQFHLVPRGSKVGPT